MIARDGRIKDSILGSYIEWCSAVHAIHSSFKTRTRIEIKILRLVRIVMRLPLPIFDIRMSILSIGRIAQQERYIY